MFLLLTEGQQSPEDQSWTIKTLSQTQGLKEFDLTWQITNDKERQLSLRTSLAVIKLPINTSFDLA